MQTWREVNLLWRDSAWSGGVEMVEMETRPCRVHSIGVTHQWAVKGSSSAARRAPHGAKNGSTPFGAMTGYRVRKNLASY